MFEMFKKYHIIHNFPKGYAFYKKVFANVIYFLTGIIIHPRKNFLTHGDLLKARLKLRKGDIVMVGNLRETSSLFIRGPLTHAALYVGRKRFIHAIADGVQYTTLHHIFTEYDTMVIMRIPSRVKGRRKIIKDAIHHAKLQLWKPYDFDFTSGTNKFFCTELVNYAYRKAHHETYLKSVSKFEEKSKLMRKLISASRALHPIRMVEEGNFKIVFMSHNLKMKNKLSLKL